MPVNDTIRRFGYPETLVAEFDHWLVLLRPAQPTLYSLILAAKGEATAFGNLPGGAHAELQRVTKAIEGALCTTVAFERINYLMLMMADPHVHFHVIPRYQGARDFAGLTIVDAGWPGPPDLKAALKLNAERVDALVSELRQAFAQF